MSGDLEAPVLHDGVNDASRPLRGAVICCTSVPEEKRTELTTFCEQMGAKYRADLTLEVTHLIVGDYKTLKYRYVAKERGDIRPMQLEWVKAVRDLWIQDKDIDMEALEKEYALPTLDTLKISMTGCDDPIERKNIADKVTLNGARYEGDLTKQITHLISFRTEGAKYKAARSWGIRVVAPEWLWDSLERGMILDEEAYDPVIPFGERGQGAWDRTKKIRRSSLGKRAAEGSFTTDNNRRKLRRTASARITNQSQQMWEDIIGAAPAAQNSKLGQWDEVTGIAVAHAPRKDTEPSSSQHAGSLMSSITRKKVFDGCRFYVYGFDGRKTAVLQSHLSSNGGKVGEDIHEMHLGPGEHHSMLVLPSEMPVSEHPHLSKDTASIQKVTEWWVERCLHQNAFCEPAEHVIGRPLPKFPINSFLGMIISSAAFLGIDRLHVGKVTELLGANYSEDFTPQVNVLVTKSAVGLRKDKLQHAQNWNIPVVRAEWLWDSIEAETRLPFDTYLLRGPARTESAPASKGDHQTIVGNGQRPRHSSLEPGFKAGGEPSFDVAGKTVSLPKEKDTSAISVHEEQPILADPTVVDLAVAEVDDVAPEGCQPLQQISPNSPSKPASVIDHQSTTPLKQQPTPQDQEDLNDALTNLIAANRNTKATNSNPEFPDAINISGLPRKRRENRIRGRIPSNLSVESRSLSRATSVDSTATNGNPVDWGNTAPKQIMTLGQTTNKSSFTAVTTIEELMREDTRRSGDEDTLPPATQLNYVDPESEEQRERVMAKMRGEKVDRATVRNRDKSKSLTVCGVVGVGFGEKKGRARGRPSKPGFR